MKRIIRKNLRKNPLKKMILASASLTLVAAIATPFILSAGCQQPQKMPPRYAPEVAMNQIIAEPKIRIRIAIRKPNIVVSAQGPFQIGLPQANSTFDNTITFNSQVQIAFDGKSWIIQPANQDGRSWAVPNISISSPSGKIKLNNTIYPGHLTLHPRTPQADAPTSHAFDVINHVNLEQYLPGVLHKELFANWHLEAYRAQAIAARSYAIAKMDMRKKRHFDLEASQTSQAYAGSSTRYNARRATEDTKGIVLTYNNNVLPAYYSSCVGGISQDAHLIFPHQNPLPPLSTKVVGPWGSNSPYYKWGPIHRDAKSYSKRLRAWGKKTSHPLLRLGIVTDITPSQVNTNSRPSKYSITDNKQQHFQISAEQLRIASNFKIPSLPNVGSKTLVRSSFLAFGISSQVIAINGNGYGHGVGMGQYGAQHMASSGNNAYQILGFYYPSAKLFRLYR